MNETLQGLEMWKKERQESIGALHEKYEVRRGKCVRLKCRREKCGRLPELQLYKKTNTIQFEPTWYAS